MSNIISSLEEAANLKLGELIENKEYPIGTLISFRLYGFHTGRKFAVISDGRSLFKGCVYEGFGDLFSHHGQMLPDIAFFRLEPDYDISIEAHTGD